jgi:hypothetical protein
MLLLTFHTMMPLVLPVLHYGVNNIACSFFDNFFESRRSCVANDCVQIEISILKRKSPATTVIKCAHCSCRDKVKSKRFVANEQKMEQSSDRVFEGRICASCLSLINQSFFAGVSNEVALFATVFCVFILPFLFYLFYHNR